MIYQATCTLSLAVSPYCVGSLSSPAHCNYGVEITKPWCVSGITDENCSAKYRIAYKHAACERVSLRLQELASKHSPAALDLPTWMPDSDMALGCRA